MNHLETTIETQAERNVKKIAKKMREKGWIQDDQIEVE